MSQRNGKRICRLLELQEDYIEEEQSDKSPLKPTEYVCIHPMLHFHYLQASRQNGERQVFVEESFEENRFEDGNKDWDGTGNDQRLFREAAFENQDLGSLRVPKRVSKEQGTLRGKRDGSIEKGSNSEEDSYDVTKDKNDQRPSSVVSNKPVDVLDSGILGSHPPQVVVSSWLASEISHLSQVIPRMGYSSSGPEGFPSFREGYPSFGEELF